MPTDESTLKLLRELDHGEAKHQGEIAPRVHAYGSVRPMGRIRSYTSAGLAPFAGRGAQSEFHLLGHIHITPEGTVQRVEGFNGQEGERWAKQAADKLRASKMLTPDAVVQPLTPLRACAATGIR